MMQKVIGEILVSEEWTVYKDVTTTTRKWFKKVTAVEEEVDFEATMKLHEKVAKSNGIIPNDAALVEGSFCPRSLHYGHIKYTSFKVVTTHGTETMRK